MTNLPAEPPAGADRQISSAESGRSTLPALGLASPPWQPPVLGSLAAVFGIVALFKATLFLAPLGLAFAIAAGCCRQFG